LTGPNRRDFHIEFVEQLISHFAIVNATRDHHRSHSWQTVAGLVTADPAMASRHADERKLIDAMRSIVLQGLLQLPSAWLREGEVSEIVECDDNKRSFAPGIHSGCEMKYAWYFRLALAKHFLAAGTYSDRRGWDIHAARLIALGEPRSNIDALLSIERQSR